MEVPTFYLKSKAGRKLMLNEADISGLERVSFYMGS
jgi:hypothetical protein